MVTREFSINSLSSRLPHVLTDQSIPTGEEEKNLDINNRTKPRVSTSSHSSTPVVVVRSVFLFFLCSIDRYRCCWVLAAETKDWKRAIDLGSWQQLVG